MVTYSLKLGNDQRSNSGLFERLLFFVDELQARWRASLRLRIIIVILLGGTFGLLLTALIVTTQIRVTIFDRVVNSSVEQFSADLSSVDEKFISGSFAQKGQAQQFANELVAKMYDSDNGVVGVALLGVGQGKNKTYNIVDTTVASAIDIRPLLSAEMRSEVHSKNSIAWQSISIKNEQGDSVPAVLMGAKLVSVDNYELYALYSLEKQEELVLLVYRALLVVFILMFFFLLVLTVILLKMILRPITEVSNSASQLAQGNFDTRMVVRGTDEFASLAKSFNSMASSLQDQFMALEKMSTLQTNFVSAVSHELRSPVTTIRMAGQLLYDKREELPSALKRSVELQYDQVNNLDTMLSDLLEISRYDAGAMELATEKVDLGSIVARVMEICAPLAQENGVEAKLNLVGDTTAEVEPRRIERIVRNLVVNALEHADGNPVEVTVQGNDTAVGVEVLDHGVGMTLEQANHVFDRFWRADSSRVRKTGGTGLGLTIAREDARLHGGALEVTGELGVGSVFVLTVPKVLGSEFVKPIVLPVYETTDAMVDSEEVE